MRTGLFAAPNLSLSLNLDLLPLQTPHHTTSTQNICEEHKASSPPVPGTRTSPIHPLAFLPNSYNHLTHTIDQTSHTSKAYMSNRPFATPAFGPVRGRGAFNPAFQPYPAARGRGQRDSWPAPRGRGRGPAAGLGGLPSRTDPTRNAPPVPSQPRQIRINDIVFELDAKGSKLTRITCQFHILRGTSKGRPLMMNSPTGRFRDAL